LLGFLAKENGQKRSTERPCKEYVWSPVWGLEIRQDFFSYPPAINTPVQIPSHQTFIIASRPSFYARPESRPFPVVYFDLGSTRLSPDANNKLLMELRECCAACPLYLIGYTCSIGIESQNLKLSRYRAEAVATMLGRNGYKVAWAEGKVIIYTSQDKKIINNKSKNPTPEGPALG